MYDLVVRPITGLSLGVEYIKDDADDPDFKWALNFDFFIIGFTLIRELDDVK